MTKKEAKTHKEAWNLALIEHRVVNFNHGERWKEYKTAEEAAQGAAEALAVGMPAMVVDVEAINTALRNLGCEPK